MTSELAKERLATTDESGRRVYLYPASVSGRFRNMKRWAHPILLVLFLVLPWIHISGQQLLLFDIGRKEFYFFGLHFRSHDAPLILFLFLFFTFLIGLVSAIWGRLWCGWACPQTVFTEFLFRKIESFIEGNHRQRKALDEGPMTNEKFGKKVLKWTAFTLISLVITHSFLAYFVGSYEIIKMISTPPNQNWNSFLVILGTTGIILFDFGWFREQFCVIMCPYGRFQSVMLDSHSLVVGYDPRRGEPRRGFVPPDSTQGDCVNCLRCVQVCPTGIDIRRGLQMECIACTACIDACDEVMEKIKKPPGLISYTTLALLAGRKPKRFTARAAAYGFLLIAALGAFSVTLLKKEFLEVTVLRAAGLPYEMQPQSGGNMVINHFRVDLSNQTGKDESPEFRVENDWKKKGVELVMPLNPFHLPNNGNLRVDFFLRFPSNLLERGAKKIPIQLKLEHSERRMEVTIVGPNA